MDESGRRETLSISLLAVNTKGSIAWRRNLCLSRGCLNYGWMCLRTLRDAVQDLSDTEGKMVLAYTTSLIMLSPSGTMALR